MVDKRSGRGGRQAVAPPTKILEVALEKETKTRERPLEMAMLAMQRERMERLDVYDMAAGSGNPQAKLKRLLRTCRRRTR